MANSSKFQFEAVYSHFGTFLLGCYPILIDNLNVLQKEFSCFLEFLTYQLQLKLSAELWEKFIYRQVTVLSEKNSRMSSKGTLNGCAKLRVSIAGFEAYFTFIQMKNAYYEERNVAAFSSP